VNSKTTNGLYSSSELNQSTWSKFPGNQLDPQANQPNPILWWNKNHLDSFLVLHMASPTPPCTRIPPSCWKSCLLQWHVPWDWGFGSFAVGVTVTTMLAPHPRSLPPATRWTYFPHSLLVMSHKHSSSISTSRPPVMTSLCCTLGDFWVSAPPC
jgi:hypothetical protein